MSIIILGDVMLDINHYCDTTRRASEADVPIYNILNTEYILGAASNVANNLKKMECNVEIISVIGNDVNGGRIKQIMDDFGIKHKLYLDQTRHTTQKTRLIYNNTIINRHDVETATEINQQTENEIFEYVQTIPNVSAIIISDYNKGVITPHLCETIIRYANLNNIYTFIDPRVNHFIKYKHCFCFKPNLLEGETISGKKYKNEIMQFIKETIECENVVLTCSENGMYINEINNHIYHKEKISVVDVTGCGDIVLSVMVYAFLQNNDLLNSAKIANYFAGKAVQTIGNYCVSKAEVDEYVNDIIYDSEINKILNIKKNNEFIVFTNGCFDVIHSAHIRLLQFAKKHGGVLVVGINSDDSVKRFKGDSRPINDINERCELLKSLHIIDYIIIFDGDSPIDIVSLLRPNIMIKGGDYEKDEIIGKEFAGEIVLFDYFKELSSTNTINRIKNASQN